MTKWLLILLLPLMGCSGVPCDYKYREIVIIKTEPWYDHKGMVLVTSNGSDIGVAVLDEQGEYTGVALGIPCSAVEKEE